MLYYLYSMLAHIGFPSAGSSLFADMGAPVTDSVYIGSLATAYIVGGRFKTIVNLSGRPYEAPPGVAKLDIFMADEDVSSDAIESYIRLFATGARFIKDNPGPYLIHCMAGVNRSATLIMWHLIDLGWTFDDAYLAIARANATRGMPLLTNRSFVTLLKAKYQLKRLSPV